MGRPDPWKCSRKRGQNFTAEERARVRRACKDGERPADVARELQCATRTVEVNFAKLRGIKSRPRPKALRRPPPMQSRLYHSTFEPS